jgi:hypothetical protein
MIQGRRILLKTSMIESKMQRQEDLLKSLLKKPPNRNQRPRRMRRRMTMTMTMMTTEKTLMVSLLRMQKRRMRMQR